jgi:hypothetical protein
MEQGASKPVQLNDQHWQLGVDVFRELVEEMTSQAAPQVAGELGGGVFGC